MAGENDAFSVLGRIEVDLKALRASLGSAEAEVQASASRQKKTYTDFANSVVEQQRRLTSARGGAQAGQATGLYKLLYGDSPGGAEAAARVTEKAAGGFRRLTSESGRSVGSMRSLAQAINLVVPGVGGMTSAVLQSVRFLGPWGAALIAVSLPIRNYVKELQAAAERNFQFKRSLATGDIGRIEKVLNESNEALARNVDLAERAGGKWDSLGGAVSGYIALFKLGLNEITGEGLEATGSRAADAAAKFSAAYKEIEVPKNTREFKKELNQLDQEGVKLWLAQADTAEKVKNGYDALRDAMREGVNLRKEEIDAATEQIIKARGLSDEQAKPLRAEAAKRRLIEELRLADAVGRNAEEQKRKIAELTTAEVEHTNKIVAENAKRERSVSSLRVVEIQTAGQIAQTRAEALREVVSGAESIKRAFAEQAAVVMSADAAAQAMFERTSANLKSLIAKDIDVAANRRKLLELETGRETEAADARNKLLELAAQKAAALAGEANRTYNAELARVMGTQEAFFNARRAFGESTLRDEIGFQQALNELYREGTADWYNGMAKVAQLQKQMRDEARGTFQDVAGESADALRAKGRKRATLSELQREAENIVKQDERLLREATSGRAVDTEMLLRAVGRQPGRERFAAQGGNLRDLFELATTPGQTSVGAGVRPPAEDFSGVMKASADLFNTGVADFRDAVKRFAAAATTNNNPLNDPDASSRLGRMSQLEARRGPARQATS